MKVYTVLLISSSVAAAIGNESGKKNNINSRGLNSKSTKLFSKVSKSKVSRVLVLNDVTPFNERTFLGYAGSDFSASAGDMILREPRPINDNEGQNMGSLSFNCLILPAETAQCTFYFRLDLGENMTGQIVATGYALVEPATDFSIVGGTDFFTGINGKVRTIKPVKEDGTAIYQLHLQ